MYELMVIGRGVDADELEKVVEKHLKDLSVTQAKLEKLGKKTLAYPISSQVEAEFLLWVFEAEGDAILQLNEKLRMEQEHVLRFLLTKFNPSKVSKVAHKVSEQEPKPKAKVTVTTKIREKAKTEEPKKTTKSAKVKESKTKKGKK